jgi:hypothetical protein
VVFWIGLSHYHRGFSPVTRSWNSEWKPFETVSGCCRVLVHRAEAAVLMRQYLEIGPSRNLFFSAWRQLISHDAALTRE